MYEVGLMDKYFSFIIPELVATPHYQRKQQNCFKIINKISLVLSWEEYFKMIGLSLFVLHLRILFAEHFYY